MRTLLLIFAFHFFLGVMMFVSVGGYSPDSRKGLREASELMVKNLR